MVKPIEVSADFDLRQTLGCGQCFRWREISTDGDSCTWEGVAHGKSLKIKQDASKIYFYCGEGDFADIWYAYFDLDTDYGKIRRELSEMSPILREAAQYAPGIRILRQEPWEALCSFIISQNNRIPRIMAIIDRLCEHFGDELDAGFHSFPDAGTLAALSADDLEPIRAGFRSKYIIDAARRVSGSEIDFRLIQDSDTAAGRAELQKIFGVGPKVADCALLYGFHKISCFPMDTWMNKAMKKFFPEITPEDFGENAGVAQQYIFHYSRMHPELFSDKSPAVGFKLRH